MVSLTDIFRIANPGNEKTKINISISLKFYKELEAHGASKVLKREYGDLLTTPEDGTSFYHLILN